MKADELAARPSVCPAATTAHRKFPCHMAAQVSRGALAAVQAVLGVRRSAESSRLLSVCHPSCGMSPTSPTFTQKYVCFCCQHSLGLGVTSLVGSRPESEPGDPRPVGHVHRVHLSHLLTLVLWNPRGFSIL